MAHNSTENSDSYRHLVSQLQDQVHELEKKVMKVKQFYQSTDSQQNDCKTKGCEKPPTGPKKPLKRASEEMQNEVMRLFSRILTEIMTQKRAWPFLEPVDVEGLQLDDYYQVIEKPMDLGTIRKKMKAKDCSGYNNVREIYADVTLVFMNAMKYNNEKHEIHLIAKDLLEKFEKKWQNILPKVVKAEIELSKEEGNEEMQSKLAEDATYANMAKGLSTELSKMHTALTDLKSRMIAQSRKLSTDEKILIAKGMNQLSADNLKKALQIIIENDPNFKFIEDEMETPFDLETQSNYTQWRLYVLVKQALDDKKNMSTHEDNIEEKNHNEN